jgi:antitoxin component YwqK of YwqJK toxin-antitoxin module
MSAISKIETYIASNDAPSDTYLSKIEIFNETGQLIEEASFYPDGSVENKNIFVYENELLIEQKNYIDNNELTEHRQIFRDENGKTIREEIIYLDESKTIKEYKRQENFLEIFVSDSEDGDEFVEKYVMDNRNRILLKEIFDVNGNCTERIENTFVEDSLVEVLHFTPERGKTVEKMSYSGENIKERVLFTEKGDLIQSVKFFYDQQNRLAEYVYSNGYRLVNEYDDQLNRRIEKHFQSNGIIEYQKEFYLDSENRVVKEVDFQNTTTLVYDFFE